MDKVFAKRMMVIISLIGVWLLMMAATGFSATYEHYVNAWTDTPGKFLYHGNASAIDSVTADSNDPTADGGYYWYNTTTVSSLGMINNVWFSTRNAITGASSSDRWRYEWGIASTAGDCSTVGSWTTIAGPFDTNHAQTYYNITNSSSFAWSDLDNVCLSAYYNRVAGDDNIETQIDAFWVKIDYTPLGTLNVTLIAPTGNVSVDQNETFNVTVNITCSSAGSCGNVNGTIFYNLSTVQGFNRSLESVDTHAGEEYKPGGTVVTTSTDQEMTYDAGSVQNQTVGYLFTQVAIPQAAMITLAYINFTAAASNSQTVDLLFYGEDIDDAPVINPAQDYNITLRENTTATVNWTNVPSWTLNNVYTSPDLSPIIQEIVNRGGWDSGNSLFIMVANDSLNQGPRSSWDHNGGTVPKLYIEYAVGATYPSVELNGSSTEIPFNNFTTPVNYSCGSMAASSQCYASWLVNATGAVNTYWAMNVTARSDNSGVPQASSNPNFYVNITEPSGPSFTLQFSILLAGGSFGNISNTVFPGNNTEEIWFNGTNGRSKTIIPCVATASPPSSRCQTAATPIIRVTNTGDTNFNISIRLNSTPLASIITWANISNATIMSSCSGWSLGANQTILSTSAFYITKAMCPGNATNLFLYGNFSDAPIGVTSNTLNYTSSTT